MKVLVTGATGFIGDYVIRELLRRKVDVIATSSSTAKAGEKDWLGQVRYIPLDFAVLDDTSNYYNYFNQPDYLIHLAWEGLPNYKSDHHLTATLPRQILFLENMIRNGLADLTVTGTCFEYGMQEGCLREDMPVSPQNPYGMAKDELRKKLQHLQESKNFILKWVRLFYMYGNGQNPNSLLSQLERALAKGEEAFNMSGGEQVRDFMPVEEVAEAIVRIALQKEVTGIINCSSGNPVTVKDFVLNYLAEKGKSIRLNLGYYPYADYEPMRFWGDNSKLKTIANNE